MLLEKAQHIVAPNKIKLARLHGFNRQFIRTACDHSMEPKNLARVSDPHNQGFAFARSGRQLRASLAENKNSPRILSFDKNDCMLRKYRSMFDPVKGFG
jgi:hypothetical protein